MNREDEWREIGQNYVRLDSKTVARRNGHVVGTFSVCLMLDPHGDPMPPGMVKEGEIAAEHQASYTNVSLEELLWAEVERLAKLGRKEFEAAFKQAAEKLVE